MDNDLCIWHGLLGPALCSVLLWLFGPVLKKPGLSALVCPTASTLQFLSLPPGCVLSWEPQIIHFLSLSIFCRLCLGGLGKCLYQYLSSFEIKFLEIKAQKSHRLFLLPILLHLPETKKTVALFVDYGRSQLTTFSEAGPFSLFGIAGN